MEHTFQIMDSTRRRRLRIISKGTLSGLISKANACGLGGNVVVMAENGFEIIEDSDLLLNANKPLMLLAQEQEWSELGPSTNYITQQGQKVLHQHQPDTIKVIDCAPSNLEVLTPNEYEIIHQEALAEPFHQEDLVQPGYQDVEEIGDEVDVPLSSDDQRKFNSFQIPWQKMPADLTDEMIAGEEKLTKRDLCTVTNIIIADLRKINPRVPIAVLKRVADEAKAAYPHAFVPKYKGVQLTTKSVCLLTKLIARRNYLNRAPMKKTHSSQDINGPIGKRRETGRIAASVLMYQPNIVGLEDGMREKQQWLQQEKKSAAPDMEKVYQFMESTYGLQRLDINCNSSVNNVREKWPYLFDPAHLSRHYNLLTGSDLEEFSTTLEKFKGPIIAHLSASKIKGITNVLPKITEDPADVKALKLICAYFKEDFKLLAQEFPLGTSVQDLNHTVYTETPFVAIVDTPENPVFYIFVDGQMVCEAPSFVKAMEDLLGFFYMLNVKFPKKATMTYEFIKQKLLKLRFEGARGHKNGPASEAAILRLICDINDRAEY